MEFLKKFFNDDPIKIGLCQFKSTNNHSGIPNSAMMFENAYTLDKLFNTNYKENILLW